MNVVPRRFELDAVSITTAKCTFHSSAGSLKESDMHREPKGWPKYNEIVYPPTLPGEPRRPAVS